jgi:hypothetical protein
MMETVTYEGRVYQVGKLYGCGPSGGLAKLLGLTDIHEYPFRTDAGNYGFISAINGELGTIEDAPIELIDGEWYMCTRIFDGTRQQSPLLWAAGGYHLGSHPSSQPINKVSPLYRMVKA